MKTAFGLATSLAAIALVIGTAGCGDKAAINDITNNTEKSEIRSTFHTIGQTILPTVPGSKYNNSYSYGTAEITEYTSDSAPGELFTIVRSREGVSTLSVPIAGSPVNSKFNIQAQTILPPVPGSKYVSVYDAAEITEYTSDSAPGELFTIVQSRQGVSISVTHLK